MNNSSQNSIYTTNHIVLTATPLSVFMMVISLVCGIWMIALDNNAGSYSCICILPFMYIAFCALTGKNFRFLFSSPVSLFLIGGYFIRMVISPLLFALGGYVSFFNNITVLQESVEKAVLLLSFECLVVALVMFKNSVWLQHEKTSINLYNYRTGGISVMAFALILFVALSYIFIDEIQSIYILLPKAALGEIANLTWDNETIVARGSINRYLYSLFAFIWPIVRTITPAIFIAHIYKKYGQNRNKALTYSALCAIIPAIFISGDNIAPFIGAILVLLVITRLFGKKSRKIFFVFGTVFSILLIIIVVSKTMIYSVWRGTNGIASYAQTLQAYLPGFDNMAVGFQIKNPNKLSTLFYDLYYTIPFKETLFGLSGENLSNLFVKAGNANGPIVPWGTQLSHYLGIFFGCLLTGVLINLAFKAEKNANNTDDYWRYYINMYSSILIAVSVLIYSFSIYLRTYINTLLPIIIIVALGNRKKEK